ncbi:hypothetical protein R4Y59_002743 [Enterococcus faecalis]|nr:hypothetical protein [Enterococcus faecalis]
MKIIVAPGAADVFTTNKIYSIGLIYDKTGVMDDVINNYEDFYFVSQGDTLNDYFINIPENTKCGSG